MKESERKPIDTMQYFAASWLISSLTLILFQLYFQSQIFTTFYTRFGLLNLYYLRCYLNEFFLILIVNLVFSIIASTAYYLLKKLNKTGMPANLVAVIPLVFSLTSWQAYNTQSAFINPTSVAMGIHDPMRLFAHAIQQTGIVSVLISISIGLMVIGISIGATRTTHSRLRRKKTASILLAATVTFTVFTFTYKAESYKHSDGKNLTPDLNSSEQFVNYFFLIQEFYRIHLGPFTAYTANLTQEENKPHDGLKNGINLTNTNSRSIITPQAWKADSPAPLEDYNVILILIESLRHEVPFSKVGDQRVMPNLFAMSQESAVFLKHYSVSAQSAYADIVPMSSQYPLRSITQHFYGSPSDYPKPRIYDLLKQHDYSTAIISSQDERWGGMNRYLESTYLDTFEHAGTANSEHYVEETDPGFANFTKTLSNSGKVDDAATTNTILNYLEHTHPNPFFIYTNFQNSHFPYRLADGQQRIFSTGEGLKDVGFNQMTYEMLPEMVGRYFDSLHYIDQQVGNIIQALKAQETYDRTIIVITGDTGQAFLEHSYSNHGGPMYDEVLRTPLIIKLPKDKSKLIGQYDCYTSHLNIAPSLLALVDGTQYDGFQGESLFKDDTVTPPKQPIFLTTHSPLIQQYGLIFEGYKFLYNGVSEKKELYSLTDDPKELNNLYHKNINIADRMENILRDYISAQLHYYSDPKQRQTTFPPILRVTDPATPKLEP